MENNLIGTLMFFRTMNIKPNLSELAREFNKDRHTITNMFEGKEVKERKKKPSKLDKYKTEISEILSRPGVSIKATYWYFKNEKNIECTYDNFKTFVRKNKLFEEAKKRRTSSII